MTMLATISGDLFTMGVPLLEKVIRTIAVYGGLLALLRIAGRRDLAQLNTFDLVVLLLLSNVVQNAVIGADNSLWGGLLGAAVLLGANALMVRLVRTNATAAALLEGRPTELVRDGQICKAELRRVGLSVEDLEGALRRQNATGIADVVSATLSSGGAISVQLREADVNATRGDLERLEAKLDQLITAYNAGPQQAE